MVFGWLLLLISKQKRFNMKFKSVINLTIIICSVLVGCSDPMEKYPQTVDGVIITY